MDLLSTVGDAFGIAQGALQFLGYVRSISSSAIISALFSWDGTKLHGEDIEVEKHPDGSRDPSVWWFFVKDRHDYEFVRIPVVQSCAHELVGLVAGEKNPDHRYWRWVPHAPQGMIIDGQSIRANLKVDFIVVGYKPRALVEHFTKK